MVLNILCYQPIWFITVKLTSIRPKTPLFKLTYLINVSCVIGYISCHVYSILTSREAHDIPVSRLGWSNPQWSDRLLSASRGVENIISCNKFCDFVFIVLFLYPILC